MSKIIIKTLIKHFNVAINNSLVQYNTISLHWLKYAGRSIIQI